MRLTESKALGLLLAICLNASAMADTLFSPKLVVPSSTASPDQPMTTATKTNANVSATSPTATNPTPTNPQVIRPLTTLGTSPAATRLPSLAPVPTMLRTQATAAPAAAPNGSVSGLKPLTPVTMPQSTAARQALSDKAQAAQSKDIVAAQRAEINQLRALAKSLANTLVKLKETKPFCSDIDTSMNPGGGISQENCGGFRCDYVTGRCITHAITSGDCVPGYAWDEVSSCIPVGR